MGSVYVLVLKLPSQAEIEVGKLGIFRFQAGFYLYVGSGGEGRFRRYIKGGRKRWHIDYLLENAKLCEIWVGEWGECELAEAIKNLGALIPVLKFGSSDCKCPSHLLYFRDESFRDFLGRNLRLFWQVHPQNPTRSDQPSL